MPVCVYPHHLLLLTHLILLHFSDPLSTYLNPLAQSPLSFLPHPSHFINVTSDAVFNSHLNTAIVVSVWAMATYLCTPPARPPDRPTCPKTKDPRVRDV